jgi:NAD(P)-dependent dehydrogenase (short-subunit alcohol dehydrogenase family)
VDNAAWRAGWDLKVFGYIDLTRRYLARMKARRRGVIINVIGSAGDRPSAGYVAGSVGNAALMAFTKAIGAQSPNYNVRVLASTRGSSDRDRWRAGRADLATSKVEDMLKSIPSVARAPATRCRRWWCSRRTYPLI